MAGSPEMATGPMDQIKNSMIVRVAGGLVLVAGVAFAAMKFMPHGDASANSASVAASTSVPRHRAPSAPQPASPQAQTVSASPAAASAPVASPVARPAAGEGSGAPVVTAVGRPTGAAEPAHLDEHLTYQYNALGRRDPFQSLVDGQFVGADVGGDAPPDPGGVKVVGIVWGATDQFALVEDVRGNSFVLRKGDKVQNGVVEALRRDALIVNITAEGQSQSVVIPLTRKGDQNAR